MRDIRSYALSFLIILTTLAFSLLGSRWHMVYYPDEGSFSPANPPLATAMRGFHDGVHLTELFGKSVTTGLSFVDNDSLLFDRLALCISEAKPAALSAPSAAEAKPAAVETMSHDTNVRSFTTADESYFDDACFIGDSRTVGISQYAGIENAVFLCKNSLSIYDYDKEKLTSEGKKTSIKEMLSQMQFAKIYLMVGINESGTGTPESFFEAYRDVVKDIRSLQPDALIFIQANLLVTEKKSNDGDSVTNENISARNELIATLANGTDIFYIDINESSLCENGALIAEYTWDQVHIRAQYYPIWKEFLLQHAVIF